jgi:hypothetical protein
MASIGQTMSYWQREFWIDGLKAFDTEALAIFVVSPAYSEIPMNQICQCFDPKIRQSPNPAIRQFEGVNSCYLRKR